MKKKHDTTNKTVPSNTMVFISNGMLYILSNNYCLLRVIKIKLIF